MEDQQNDNPQKSNKALHTMDSDAEAFKNLGVENIIEKKNDAEIADVYNKTRDNGAEQENAVSPTNIRGKLSPIHTYITDVGESIKNKDTSMVEIALAEHERRRQSDDDKLAQITTRKNIIYGIWIALFLIVGSTVAYTFYLIGKPKQVPIVRYQESLSLIPVDELVEVDFSDEERIKIANIKRELRNSTKAQAVKEIVLTSGDSKERIETLDLFDTDLNILPPELLRAFTTRFMLASWNKDPQQTFLIIQIESFENAFAGMLRFEDKLYNSVSSFLDLPTLPISSNVSTSTPVWVPQYNDILIQNKVTRVLSGPDGTPLLYYSFPSNNLLLIFTNTETQNEVSRRIREKAIVR